MVSIEEVDQAQRAWGDGIVKIAKAHRNGEDYTGLAENHIRTLYAYDQGMVLFKPTLASVEQFRSTPQSALSYFVASNGACPEDKGFAIKGWTKVRFENVDIIIDGGMAMAMGNYFFTDPQGDLVKVEYSFGYVLNDKGEVRIVLHHSSVIEFDKSPTVGKNSLHHRKHQKDLRNGTQIGYLILFTPADPPHA